MAFVALDDFGNGLLIAEDQPRASLRVELLRKLRRAHQIAEQNRELATLSGGGRIFKGGQSSRCSIVEIVEVEIYKILQ